MRTFIKVLRSNTYFEVGSIYEVPPRYSKVTNPDEIIDVYVGGTATYLGIPRKFVDFITAESHPEYFL